MTSNKIRWSDGLWTCTVFSSFARQEESFPKVSRLLYFAHNNAVECGGFSTSHSQQEQNPIRPNVIDSMSTCTCMHFWVFQLKIYELLHHSCSRISNYSLARVYRVISIKVFKKVTMWKAADVFWPSWKVIDVFIPQLMRPMSPVSVAFQFSSRWKLTVALLAIKLQSQLAFYCPGVVAIWFQARRDSPW